MAFSAINTSEIQVKKPVTRSLWQKVKDSLDYLNSLISGMGDNGVVNGSFELDADANGVPDTWTLSAYPGGSGAIDATVQAHGLNSFKFVHPGGAGNGGGYLRSDYIRCSQYKSEVLSLLLWASASTVKNMILIRYYTAAKVFISSTTVYSSILNNSTPTAVLGGFTPPATARWFTVDLIGGYTDTAVAGSIWFDSVSNDINYLFFKALPILAFTHSCVSSGSGTSGTWADIGTSVAVKNNAFGLESALLTISGYSLTSTDATDFRLKITTGSGTYYSDVTSTTGAGTVAATFIATIGVSDQSMTLQPQYKVATGCTLTIAAASGSGTLRAIA